jgi:hypothetical protein
VDETPAVDPIPTTREEWQEKTGRQRRQIGVLSKLQKKKRATRDANRKGGRNKRPKKVISQGRRKNTTTYDNELKAMREKEKRRWGGGMEDGRSKEREDRE